MSAKKLAELRTATDATSDRVTEANVTYSEALDAYERAAYLWAGYLPARVKLEEAAKVMDAAHEAHDAATWEYERAVAEERFGAGYNPDAYGERN